MICTTDFIAACDFNRSVGKLQLKAAKISAGTFHNGCKMSRDDMKSSIARNGVRLVMRFGTVKLHDKSHWCEQGLTLTGLVPPSACIWTAAD